MNLRPYQADLLLLLVAISWGTTFVVVQQAVEAVPVYQFLFWRFGLAFVLMVPFMAWRGRRPDRGTLWAGVVLGLINFGAYALQTFGLTHTTSSSVAFITGLFVVFVPLLGRLVFGQRIVPVVWVSSLLAVGGLWLLTTQGALQAGRGEAYAFGCAMLFALHLLYTGRFSRRYDVSGLVIVQFGTMAAASALMQLMNGGSLWPAAWSGTLVWSLGITVVFATVFAFWVQTSMQRFTSAARAAVIFTMEPLSAAIFAYAYAGEVLRPLQLAGGIIIVASMLLTELGTLYLRPKK